jgi:hypothetical protein
MIAAAGLAIDAYAHFDLASTYSGVKSSVLSQGDLFRAEATVSAIAAAAVLLRPRRYTAAFACVVATAGTATVLVYAYVNVGAFGPIPNMYRQCLVHLGSGAVEVVRARSARALLPCRASDRMPT